MDSKRTFFIINKTRKIRIVAMKEIRDNFEKKISVIRVKGNRLVPAAIVVCPVRLDSGGKTDHDL
jgi:hypothetical protein